MPCGQGSPALNSIHQKQMLCALLLRALGTTQVSMPLPDSISHRAQEEKQTDT